MVETKPAAAPNPAEAKPQPKKKRGKREGKSFTHLLGAGEYKLNLKGKSIWKYAGKKTPKKVEGETPKKLFVVKPIGGDKNGGTRTVSLVTKKKSYPTFSVTPKVPSTRRRRVKKQVRLDLQPTTPPPKRRLRASITPGKVLILLATKHRGSRVVFLKQLRSGLLLVSGPLAVNRVPLRRIHQQYVIATSTSIDISKVEIPEHINDAYFKRIKAKKSKKDQGDIFVKKKQDFKISAEKKADQKLVDNQLLRVIRKSQYGVALRQYLYKKFSLKRNMYPHKMKF